MMHLINLICMNRNAFLCKRNFFSHTVTLILNDATYPGYLLGPFSRYGANPRRCQITSIAINWIPHHWPIIKKIITVILNNVLPGINHKIKLLIMMCAIKSTLSNKKLLSPSQYVFCAHKVSAAMPAQIARATSNLLVMIIDRR